MIYICTTFVFKMNVPCNL